MVKAAIHSLRHNQLFSLNSVQLNRGTVEQMVRSLLLPGHQLRRTPLGSNSGYSVVSRNTSESAGPWQASQQVNEQVCNEQRGPTWLTSQQLTYGL